MAYLAVLSGRLYTLKRQSLLVQVTLLCQVAKNQVDMKLGKTIMAEMKFVNKIQLANLPKVTWLQL